MEQLKKTTIAIADVVEEVAKLKGTSFTILSGINISIKLSKLGFLVKDYDTILEEFKNLTDEDKVLLCSEFEKEFDIPNDEAEAKIEQTYNWLVATSELITTFMKK